MDFGTAVRFDTGTISTADAVEYLRSGDYHHLARDCVAAKIERMQAALDAVKTDKEILDWMSRKDGYTAVWQRLGDGVWCVDPGDKWDDVPHHTAREALLKAMAMGKARDGE